LTIDDIPYVDYELGYFNVNEIDAIIDALERTPDVCNLMRFRNEIVELC
jgi:hypothetical protein